MNANVDLNANGSSIAFDGYNNVVGAMATEDIFTSQTRSVIVNPTYLRQWAEYVEKAYDTPNVEIKLTPDKPLMAVECKDDNQRIGLAVTHRKPEGYDGDD